MAVSLELHDRPVGYTPPIGPPIQFDVYYSQRDVQQPTTFNYGNLGPQWTTSWTSYVVDMLGPMSSALLVQRGGGLETYAFSGASATASQPGPFSQALLTRNTDATGNTTSFARSLPDGSTEQFTAPLGRKFFLTAIVDRVGNRATLSYDGSMRLVSITDALGQVTAIRYEAADPLKITRITDPFGRSATFTYNAGGQLASITDVLGIVSAYTYGPGNFVNKLTTPYGSTTFAFGDSTTDSTLGTTRFLAVTDALGRLSRVEFNQNAPGIPSQDAALPAGMNVVNNALEQRNTYVWNPNQYKAATSGGTLDYTKATIIHWAENFDGSVSRVIESTKEPLENRIWYNYPGQPEGGTPGTSSKPSLIGRVLDDGSTQLQTFQYNAAGNPTQVTDAVGRQISYAYAANGIDVVTIRNTTNGMNDVLATLTYNNQHQPLTVTGANGATVKYQYNAAGQASQVTDQLGNVTTYTYDSNGYLQASQGPVAGAQYHFTYDNAGRVASATDPAGSTIRFTYDNADRPLTVTFPDGTTATRSYKLLDLSSTTDRLGQTTQFVYDAERELTSVTDALGLLTGFDYGADGKLNSITDPNGHTTALTLDIEGRVVTKTYSDGTAQNIVYENSTSRIHSNTDALGQVTLSTYNRDNTLSSVVYQGGGVTTAPVSFAYDPAYPRLVSMTDGIGTTTYSYYPVGTTPTLGATQLQSVASPIAGSPGTDTITYTYDAVNRVVGRSINGVAESRTFDALGRLTSASNALDIFTYGYTDATPRVAEISSNHGPTIALSYFGPKGDELLQQIKFTTPAGTVLSQFGYTYNADDSVTSFTQSYLNQKLSQSLSNRSVTSLGGYPGVGSLKSIARGVIRPSLSWQQFFVLRPFDVVVLSGPIAVLILLLRRSEIVALPRGQVAGALSAMCLATTLFLVSCGGGGGGGTSGSGNNPPPPTPTPSAQVTNYTYDADNRLVSALVGTDLATSGNAGSPQYTYAYDPASNITSIAAGGSTQSPSYTSTNTIASAVYDANGSPTTMGPNMYSWDAANRVITYTSGTNESAFSYDGLDRVVRIVDKQNGSIVSDKSYFWCGSTRCLEHDNVRTGSPVSKQYFDEGVIDGNTSYYYVSDQLGSVRQLVDAMNNVQAQYDYDPYGNVTKVGGSRESDIGYSGYFHHRASSLSFARFRAYDSNHARWLNRDPIGEAGGINLYAYVGANPVSQTDQLGLEAVPVTRLAIGNVVDWLKEKATTAGVKGLLCINGECSLPPEIKEAFDEGVDTALEFLKDPSNINPYWTAFKIFIKPVEAGNGELPPEVLAALERRGACNPEVQSCPSPEPVGQCLAPAGPIINQR